MKTRCVWWGSENEGEAAGRTDGQSGEGLSGSQCLVLAAHVSASSGGGGGGGGDDSLQRASTQVFPDSRRLFPLNIPRQLRPGRVDEAASKQEL